MREVAETSDGGAAAGADQVDPRDVLRILARHDGSRGRLIAVLEDIQTRYGYLPEAALRTVGEETGRSLVDIYGIATFYRAFTLQPRGKHLISACAGTACHVRGGPRVIREFEDQLGIKAGQTTADRQFTLETVIDDTSFANKQCLRCTVSHVCHANAMTESKHAMA